MDEDDDVIIEGSPLHSHLLDAGLTDYEIIPSKNFATFVHDGSVPSSNVVKGPWLYPCNVWHLFMIFLGIDKVENYVCYLVIEKLTKSKLLEEEDVSVIQNFSHNLEEILDGNNGLSFNTDENLKLFPSPLSPPFAIWWSSFIIGIVAHLFAWKDVSCCSFFIMLALGVLLIIRCYFVRRLLFMLKNMDAFVHLMTRVKVKTLKSLRILKENEILFKGNLSGNLFCGPNPADLYDALFSLYKSISSYLKYSHEIICTLNTAKSWQDKTSMFNYRFKEDSFETYEQHPFENLVNAKIRREVTFLQCSALLSELILYFDSSNSVKMNQPCFLFCSKQLEFIERKICILENVSKICETFWINGSCSLKKSKSFEAVKDDVSIAAKTLSFHSKRSLLKIINLSNRLDNDPALEYSPKNAATYPSYEVSMVNCEEIECQLQSCIGCLSDLRERLKRHFYKENGVKHSSMTPDCGKAEDICDAHHPSSVGAVPIMETDPRVILDEVFEAYVDDNTMQDFTVDDSSIWVSERKKTKDIQRRQKQQCKRVLLEIQPILLERRAMWERREENALKRKNESEAGSLSQPNEETSFAPTMDYDQDDKIDGEAALYPKDTFPKLYSDDDDCDSEEERLRLYKKVRRELDEDEAMRSAKEIEDACVDCLYPLSERKTDSQWESHSTSESDDEVDLDILASRKEMHGRLTQSASYPMEDHLKKMNGDCIKDEKKVDIQAVTDGICETSPCNQKQDSTKAFVPTVRSISPIENISTRDKRVEMEIFSSGDELSDSDDRIIDWSSCGFARPSPQSLEDRLSASGVNEGFSLLSIFAEEKTGIALSLRNQVDEVTFDGYGEADEEESYDSDDESG